MNGISLGSKGIVTPVGMEGVSVGTKGVIDSLRQLIIVVYATTPSTIVYTKRYWDEMKRRSPIPGILPRQRWVRYKP